MDPETVQAVMDDHTTAPVDERVRATLVFLRKLTLEPESLDSDDIAPLRAAGLGDRAIEEAIYVAFAFNVLDRLADAFDFEVPEQAYHDKCGKFLRRLGYRRGSLPG